MIKDFMTAYWGYLPTTLKPYPASEKVNAFVGPSGHGKTTIWDGLRVVLGDTTFESKRKVENYVHPKSNWSIVRVAFFNMEKDGIRAFERYGYFEDLVVVCCRVYKNSEGRWSKEYYVFDGEFTNLFDLANNYKAYKQKLKTQEEYKKVLEDCLGITTAFRKLMAMNPESIRDMVKLSPNELFKRIFQLKGMKEIQEKYCSAKQTLAGLEIECERTEKELQDAQLRFLDYQDKVNQYNKYRYNEKHLEINSLKAKKLEYFEKTNFIETLENNIIEKEKNIKEKSEKLIQINLKCENLYAEIEAISLKIEESKREYEQCNEKIDELNPELMQVNSGLDVIGKKVDKLCAIEKKDPIELGEKFSKVQNHRRDSEYEFTKAKNLLKELEMKYEDLINNRPLYPNYVQNFLVGLKSANIEHLILADAISVKPEFKEWQKAVEAYLGNNRFRVIVTGQKEYIEAKKLQEKLKYTARVCTPKAYVKKDKKSSNNLLSISQVIEISCPDKIAGYLKGLDEVFLVETVEEGHELQKRSIVSITKEGLLQDNDGAIFRRCDTLCCGKLAIKTEKEEVEEELIKQKELVKTLKTKAEDLSKDEKELNELIEDINELKNLSKYQNELVELNRQKIGLETEQDALKMKRDNVLSEQENQHKNDKLKNVELTQNISEAGNIEQQMKILKNEIEKLNKDISDNKEEFNSIISILHIKGLNDDDICFIKEDIKAPSYRNENGEVYKSSDLIIQCNMLRKKIDEFKEQYPELNEKIITLLNAQKNRVDEMSENIKELREKRYEWNEECITSLNELRHHIKVTIKDYVEEFQKLAELLKATARGRLEEKGEDPEYWELYLYIGFDGKSPTLIDGPELSSGQKACTSLMLLLAAVNDRKEGGNVPIMFLDEPKSRLDDSRGNEVGALLQLTDVQYFITHQHGESLRQIDWINHCFSVSVCQPNEEFAPPMIFKRMRVG